LKAKKDMRELAILKARKIGNKKLYLLSICSRNNHYASKKPQSQQILFGKTEIELSNNKQQENSLC